MKIVVTIPQDPVYTTSVGEISEIADPEWLVKFREVASNLQYGAAQWNQGYELSEYSHYEESAVTGYQVQGYQG